MTVRGCLQTQSSRHTPCAVRQNIKLFLHFGYGTRSVPTTLHFGYGTRSVPTTLQIPSRQTPNSPAKPGEALLDTRCDSMKKTLLVLAICAATVADLMLSSSRGRHTFTFPSSVAANETLTSAPAAGSSDTQLDDWPQWRGVRRDGVATATNLLDEWPTEGPPLVWSTSGLGSGMSSVAIVSQSIFTLGRRRGKVMLMCRSTVDGSERWSADLQANGEPNATPTVDGDLVYAVTRDGKIVCASTASGEIIWTRDFVADFGGSVPTWGYSESPLVEEGLVICTPGADDALVVALERTTGNTAWKSALPPQMRNKGHGGAGYSSPVVSQAAGVRHYVQMFGGGVIGVSAVDGSVLWGYSRVANGTAVIPTPIVQDDLVFVSSGYGTGAALLQLTRTASGLEPQELHFYRGNQVQNHHGGMVLVDGHIYLGHGHNRGHPLCLDLASGTVKWGPERGPGSGSAAIAFADGHLYFRYEDAKLALIEATPSGYHLKSVFELPSKRGKSWPHPAIAHKRLYLRDQDVLLCYDLEQN